MKAQERYNLKKPSIGIRIPIEHLNIIDEMIKERKKWEADFNRQSYVRGLIEKDLKRLELI